MVSLNMLESAKLDSKVIMREYLVSKRVSTHAPGLQRILTKVDSKKNSKHCVWISNYNKNKNCVTGFLRNGWKWEKI